MIYDIDRASEAERLTSKRHVVTALLLTRAPKMAYTHTSHSNYDVYVAPPQGAASLAASPGTPPAVASLAGRPTEKCAHHRHRGQLPPFPQLFLVHADGSGMPEPLPLPAGEEGSFSPDGKSLAYKFITR